MWIEFGDINYKLIIPFIYPFLYQIRKLIHQNDKKPFYEFFTNYCGYFFSGLIYLIIVCRMRKIQKQNDLTNPNGEVLDNNIELETFSSDDNTSKSSVKSSKKIRVKNNCTIKNQIIIEKEKINKRQTRKKYLFILGLTIIYLIPMFLDSYCSSNQNINFKTSSSVSVFFCIISYVLLSRLILGHKIYRHQIFSLTIIIVCNIISIILILTGEKNKVNSDMAINFVIMAVILSLYALYNVLEKIFFNSFMTSPYYLMFIIGLITLVLIIIYETITCLAFGDNKDFNGAFYQIKYNIKNIKLYPLLFIGDVISAFLWVGGIHLTVYFFSPCHFIISESISQILSTIINNSLEGYNIAATIVIYVLFVIIIFASLIYNEIIILKFWKLNINTKKHITKRSNSELLLMFKNEQKKDNELEIEEIE